MSGPGTRGGEPLTICTVAFGSRRFVEMNLATTAALNPRASVEWIVVENTPEGLGDAFERDRPDVRVLAGPLRDPAWDRPSSRHHAEALAIALRRTRTRYVLVLDPDFYVVRHDWIERVLGHMRVGGLSFFGAPWHPRWYAKVRYFPSAHCLFIDTARVAPNDLDFRPQRDHLDAMTARLARGGVAMRILRRLALRDRRVIGASRDTGWKLYDRYHAAPDCRYDLLVPVFRPGEDLGVRWHGGPFERLLPERLRYVPGRDGSFSEAGFREGGWPDVRAWGAEEFLWQGRPFGFHVRSFVRDDGARESTYERVGAALEAFVRRRE